MNLSASSSIEVAQTMSAVAGPSSDVDIPHRSWPTIPTHSLCDLIQKLLREEKLLGEERMASPKFRQTLQKKLGLCLKIMKD